MRQTKKGARAVRKKNKSESPERQSDSEMEAVSPAPTPKGPKTKANAAFSDFKLQSQIHLDKLDEAFEQGAKVMRLQYRKLLNAIDPDILCLTLSQFERLRETYNSEKNQDKEETPPVSESVSAAPLKTTQSPNVTSTQRRSSRNKTDSGDDSNYATPREAPAEDSSPEKEKEAVEPPKNAKKKNSELVLYKPQEAEEDVEEPHNAMTLAVTPASNFTGMPSLNLFIPVKNGLALTLLGHPVDDVGILPNISPSVMQGLEIMKQNIDTITKAWKQQQKMKGNRKSIQAGPSSAK